MRILAIIPACEGSVTLPNKNMRIIHGKPMIYYVINNALRSKYITDVIVTSNSNEIISLAKKMQVMTRCRREELSSPSVSLDMVIWDVFEQLQLSDYDYVITMQSIAPTLLVETLDRAIEKALTEEYDTLISVKNQPQFYWSISEGMPIPHQNKRMNRHQLPPFYMETGAFLITKADCISPDSRIGEKIGLYELMGDEAIDVNSFGDIKQVENAMKRQTTAIFVNGNADIGLGHISRTLQIADELFTKPDFYFDSHLTEKTSFGHTTYQLYSVKGSDEFISAVSTRGYDIIIIDNLDTSETFMCQLRDALPKARIINFEDDGDGAQYADAVINALYEEKHHDNVIFGSEYFIIQKLFLLYEPIAINEKIQNVVVTFGGADPKNYTGMFLELAEKPEYAKVNFYVVIGKANKKADCFEKYNEKENIILLYDIDNMAEVMAKCDIAVSSRGRTCFELAALGIPTLSIAQHEREERHTFICAENGFMCLDSHADKNTIEEAFNALMNTNRSDRQYSQNMMLSHDLRNGRKNVANIILSVD